MTKLNILLVAFILVCTACSKDEEPATAHPILEETQGYNMLLIGNSFFRPYADKIEEQAIDAGYVNHKDITVFRGGDNGRPINLWNDTGANNQLIKETLDAGNVDVFGMTAGKLPENPTDGFRDWIAYALQNNPNITVFLSIPPPDFPADWEQLAQDNGFTSIEEGYEYFINETVHEILVDALRAEFPYTNIFTIPTGWATIQLAQMQVDNLLLDDIALSGPRETSIFTDTKGHQGDIVRETGGLIWLSSIYNVDLGSNTYETGFNTDLHKIAQDIINAHNPNYKK